MAGESDKSVVIIKQGGGCLSGIGGLAVLLVALAGLLFLYVQQHSDSHGEHYDGIYAKEVSQSAEQIRAAQQAAERVAVAQQAAEQAAPTAVPTDPAALLLARYDSTLATIERYLSLLPNTSSDPEYNRPAMVTWLGKAKSLLLQDREEYRTEFAQASGDDARYGVEQKHAKYVDNVRTKLDAFRAKWLPSSPALR